MIAGLPHELHPAAFERAATIAHGTIAGWCMGRGEDPPALTAALKEAYEQAFAVVFNAGVWAGETCAQCGQARARHGGEKNLGACPDLPAYRWRPLGGWANDSGKTPGTPDHCIYCGATKADGVRLARTRAGGVSQYACAALAGCRKRQQRAARAGEDATP